ncbi:hypothetical protein M501DRAFT_1016765 [Patellaria atrata CBS 101060]|uniref:Uncharacterized protein n=1 Tax=Patellaria atrata CBS 101060 TaxID=1346257 RepID=A0A9P4S9P5_9PEZI|nr:hypothetical protein M501DRAFT_1016765 [Patellaria atrata CBS 101060]
MADATPQKGDSKDNAIDLTSEDNGNLRENPEGLFVSEDEDIKPIIPELHHTRSLTKAKASSAQIIDEEQNQSLMAGIEHILAADAKKKKRKVRSGEETANIPSMDGRTKKNVKMWISNVLGKEGREGQNKVVVSREFSPNTITRKKRTVAAARELDSQDLVDVDVFEASRENESGARQPELPENEALNGNNKKQSALAQLIASLPEDRRKSASGDKAMLLEAAKVFGRGRCMPNGNSGWRVKGMKSSLTHHQVLGAGFMREREEDKNGPFGGLNADQMGLGKTVMMLANIITSRPAKSKNTKSVDRQTTLIVVPASLISQWGNEIKAHCEDDWIGNVIKYRSNDKSESTLEEENLLAHDFVLTTYYEVSKSYPKCDPPKELQTSEEKIVWWNKYLAEERGLLHRVVFYRVVLDEAQAIKNYKSHTSIACRGLIAKRRWALSGTPIMNTIEELYPYFKFLQVPYTGSVTVFKENYCGDGDMDKASRLLARLSQFMIRRTHRDQLFGAPILKLPRATPVTIQCELNTVERAIYDIVLKRMINRINQISRNGELKTRYRHIYTMLLKLRQLASHPLLVQIAIYDLLDREDVAKLRAVVEEGLTDADVNSTRQIAHIRNVLIAAQRSAESATTTVPIVSCAAVPMSAVDEDDTYGGLHGKSYNFLPYLEQLKGGKDNALSQNDAPCSACNQKPEEPFRTSCSHIYCESCLPLPPEGASKVDRYPTCTACDSRFFHFQKVDPAELPADDPAEEPTEDPTEGATPLDTEETKEKLTKYEKELRRRGMKDWLAMERHVLPSAKTVAVKAQILNWLREDPDCKIIVFTQWLNMIYILSSMLADEGWPCLTFSGQMSKKAKAKTLKDFGDKECESKVLVASLKCGGVGLNLTMASRVIIMDPWWNKAIEQQAFCRVFRIGQKQETYMTRIVVNNTVDQNLLKMQETKQIEIDKVMEDGGTAESILIEDLLRLFGPTRTIKSGQPFILVEDPEQHRMVDVSAEEDALADSL